MIRGAVERAPAHCAVVSSAVVFEKLFAKANSCVRWLQAVVLRSGAGGSPEPFSTSVAQRGVHATLVTLSFLAPPSAPIVADLPPLPLSWQIPDNAHNQDVLVETEVDVASSPGEEGSRTDRTLSTGGDGGGSVDRRDSADDQHRVPAADRQERYRRAPSRTASPRSLLPRG